MPGWGSTSGAGRGRRTALRYWLLQLPGTVLLVVVLLLLHRWFDLPLWAAGLITVAWVIKDAVLYPFLKHAFDPSLGEQHHSPIGRLALVRDGLGHSGGPRSGYVQLGGELWQAELVDGAESVAPGGYVRVVEQRGLRLEVEPVAAIGDPEGPSSDAGD